MTRYAVSLTAHPVKGCRPLNHRDALSARRVVAAPCAQWAACEVAAPYLQAGLVVDWRAHRAGLRRIGRSWRGWFSPGDGDDGLSGVREPRRPHPSVGSAAAADKPRIA
jgi:hypothetical protein